MKSVLITGAFGQLGKSCSELLKNNFELILSGIHPSDSGIKLDVIEQKSVKTVLDKKSPDTIVNLAALTDVDQCEVDIENAYRINVDGVKNLCKHFTGHFIQISTDYVFDGKSGPYSENDKTNPINIYGQSKLKGENVIIKNNHKYFIIRLSWLFSKYDNSNYEYIIQRFMKA